MANEIAGRFLPVHHHTSKRARFQSDLRVHPVQQRPKIVTAAREVRVTRRPFVELQSWTSRRHQFLAVIDDLLGVGKAGAQCGSE
jgi:hypothetical protein